MSKRDLENLLHGTKIIILKFQKKKIAVFKLTSKRTESQFAFIFFVPKGRVQT